MKRKERDLVKKKIIFCMNHMIMGGIEKVLCHYLSSLQKDGGFECFVISKNKITEKVFLDFFYNNNIELINGFGITLPRAHFYLWKKLFCLYRWIEKKIFFVKNRHMFADADVVIDFANFFFNKELVEIKHRKIGWCHGSITFFNNVIDKRYLGIYDKIVCLSDSFKKDFQEQYPQYADKIVRIYNPMEIEKIRSMANAQSGYDISAPYFIAVQRLNNDKDVSTVIRAFNIVSANHPEVKLYIVGDGPDFKKIKDLSKSNKNIICTGQINNVYRMIQQSRALILASTTRVGEGFAMVLLEAQALGTVAISSRVKSGPAEVLLNGEAGYLFEPGNADELSSIMEEVLTNQDKVNQIKKCATDNLDRFDSENIVRQFKELISK